MPPVQDTTTVYMYTVSHHFAFEYATKTYLGVIIIILGCPSTGINITVNSMLAYEEISQTRKIFFCRNQKDV